VIYDFWLDYFKNTMKLSEAEAKLRAAERIQIALQDDEDIFDMLDAGIL
jgi:hypothetical protein